MPAPRSQLDRALRVAAVLVLVVLSVLGATEALLRALFDPPLRPYTEGALAGPGRTPGYRAFKLSIEDGKPFDFAVNALGFRGKSMQTAAKPSGTARIFFVGGRGVENQHLPEEKTFPAIVEEKLRARGARVEVGNGGLAGQGAARSFALVAHRLLDLEPDGIVLVLGPDDLLAALDERWDPVSTPPPPTLKEWLVGRSRLFQLLFAPQEVDLAPLLAKRRKEARARPYSEGPDPARGAPAFEAYLHRIALVCDDAKVPVVLATAPALWKDELSLAEKDALWQSATPTGHADPVRCRKALEVYDEALRRAAKGRVLVDLDRLVPRDLVHFVDDTLLTVEGNAVAAEPLSEALSALLAARKGR